MFLNPIEISALIDLHRVKLILVVIEAPYVRHHIEAAAHKENIFVFGRFFSELEECGRDVAIGDGILQGVLGVVHVGVKKPFNLREFVLDSVYRLKLEVR